MEGGGGGPRSNGHLYRIFILLLIMLTTSIVLIVVFVAKHDSQPNKMGIIPHKPELFTPPTLLAK